MSLRQGQVVYKQVDGQSLALHAVHPDPARHPGPRPAVLLFHAGGWRNGSPAKMARMAQALAERGLACFAVAYRLIEEQTLRIPREGIEDARSAMRHVRSQAQALGVDPAHIAALGGSAGGHLAMMTALRDGWDDPADDLAISPAPQALITLSSPYNFDKYESATVSLQARREVSPFHLLRASMPPLLLLHGTADKGVPMGQVQRFCERARAVGATVQLVPFEGRGHGFHGPNQGDGADFRQCVSLIDDFLRQQWGLAPA